MTFISKKLSPVMDLDYDLSCAFHTPKILKQKIDLLAVHGFKRLHIVAPPPGNPDYSHAARILQKDGPPNFLRQSRNTFSEDPLKTAVKLAKAAGLSVIIVFKPYEGGGVFTVPHNVVPPNGRNYMDTLGGRAVGIDPFIVEHPEFLLKRKPYNGFLEQPVTKIELVFILDQIDASNDMKKMSFNNDVIIDFPAKEFFLYTSEDNGKYRKYNGNIEVRERIESRIVKDANSELVFPTDVRCRIIELSGFKITAPYFSVEFEGDGGAFRTIPNSMCSVFSDKQELPVTVSPTLRHKESGMDTGFEFEEVGPYYFDCGWRSSTLFAFARGKLKYQRGSLCEAYPEVRKYWLQQIAGFIDMGADAVEIRLQSHCSGVTDFINYGFNAPLIDAFSKKHGINILTQAFDPIELMKVRGKFFEIFIDDSKRMLNDSGCNLLLHLHGYMERCTLNPTFHELGFWANPKILPDWCNLVEKADEVVIKDYNFGKYKTDVANEVKNLSFKLNKPLWIHCYLQQGHDWNPAFIEDVEKDQRITGILLYEVVWNKREQDGIIEIDGDNVNWKLGEYKE